MATSPSEVSPEPRLIEKSPTFHLMADGVRLMVMLLLV